jgi:hypothetical protein
MGHHDLILYIHSSKAVTTIRKHDDKMRFLILEFGTETYRKGKSRTHCSLLMAHDLLEDLQEYLQRDSAIGTLLFHFDGQGDGIKSPAAWLDEPLRSPAGSPPPSAALPPSGGRRFTKMSQYRIHWLLPLQVWGSRKAFCDCFWRTGLYFAQTILSFRSNQKNTFFSIFKATTTM